VAVKERLFAAMAGVLLAVMLNAAYMGAANRVIS